MYEPPAPWSRVRGYAIGGLWQIGYASGRDLLVVYSIQGRGVFDARTGARLARDDGDALGDFDPADGTVLGIGPLAGERVRTAGLFGGVLPRATRDGFGLDGERVGGAAQRVALVAPDGARTPVADAGVCELRAVGFSDTGRSFAVATSCELQLFARIVA